MQRTRRAAAFGVRQLLDELHLLMGFSPDLHDAFDGDELPLAFILRRDSGLMKESPEPRDLSIRADDPLRRRTMRMRRQGRRGRRTQMPGE